MRMLPPPLQLEASKAMRLDLLQQTSLAALLPSSVLSSLCQVLWSVVVTPGELLILEGDLESSAMYVVVSGTFEILSSVGNSDATAASLVNHAIAPPQFAKAMKPRPAVVVATVATGAVLGEVSFFLEGTPKTATVRAATRAQVLRIGRKELDDVVSRRGLTLDAAFRSRSRRIVKALRERYIAEAVVAAAEEDLAVSTSASRRDLAVSTSTCSDSEARQNSTAEGAQGLETVDRERDGRETVSCGVPTHIVHEEEPSPGRETVADGTATFIFHEEHTGLELEDEPPGRVSSGRVLVQGLHDGSEASRKKIPLGSMMESLNGEPVSHLSKQEIHGTLNSTLRPVTIGFAIPPRMKPSDGGKALASMPESTGSSTIARGCCDGAPRDESVARDVTCCDGAPRDESVARDVTDVTTADHETAALEHEHAAVLRAANGTPPRAEKGKVVGADKDVASLDEVDVTLRSGESFSLFETVSSAVTSVLTSVVSLVQSAAPRGADGLVVSIAQGSTGSQTRQEDAAILIQSAVRRMTARRGSSTLRVQVVAAVAVQAAARRR